MVIIALHREFFRIDSEEVKKMMKIIILESDCLGGDFGICLFWGNFGFGLEGSIFLRGNYVSCQILRNGCEGIWDGCDIHL